MPYEIFRQVPRGPLGLFTRNEPIGQLNTRGEEITYELDPKHSVTVGLVETGDVLNITSAGEPVDVNFGAVPFSKPPVKQVLDASCSETRTGRPDVTIKPRSARRGIVLKGPEFVPLMLTPEQALGFVGQVVANEMQVTTR